MSISSGCFEWLKIKHIVNYINLIITLVNIFLTYKQIEIMIRLQIVDYRL